MKSTIAIIPARGGSKRIPRKNIRNFFDRPIISYPTEVAIKSGIFDEVMVSTEDGEIASVAKNIGAQVPFLRSPQSARDSIPTATVIKECLNEYAKRGKLYQYVCCIFPTAVFATQNMLVFALSKLINGADAVVTITSSTQSNIPTLNIKAGYVHSGGSDPQYSDAGQFYFFRRDTFMTRSTMIGDRAVPIILPSDSVIDINTSKDWELAEKLFNKVTK